MQFTLETPKKLESPKKPERRFYQYVQKHRKPHLDEIEYKLDGFYVACPQCSEVLVLKECGCTAYLGCTNPCCNSTMKINKDLLVALVYRFLEDEHSNIEIPQCLN